MHFPEDPYGEISQRIDASFVRSIVDDGVTPGVVFVLGLASQPDFVFVQDSYHKVDGLNNLPDVLIARAYDPLKRFVNSRLKERHGLIVPEEQLDLHPRINYFSAHAFDSDYRRHVRFLATGLIAARHDRPRDNMKPTVRPYGQIEDYLAKKAERIIESGSIPKKTQAVRKALNLYGQMYLGKD